VNSLASENNSIGLTALSVHDFAARQSSGDTALATALGGGIDLHIAPFLSFRAIQLDYLFTRFHSDSQHQARVSTGVVLRF
jgi:hypothetical protein